MLQMTRGRKQIIIGEVVSDKMNKPYLLELNARFHILYIKNMLKNSPNFLLIVISFLQKKVTLLRLLQ